MIQTLEADGAERLARAIEDFADTAKSALGAQSRWAIASAAMPVVSV